jgi:hypothetical protein
LLWFLLFKFYIRLSDVDPKLLQVALREKWHQIIFHCLFITCIVGLLTFYGKTFYLNERREEFDTVFLDLRFFLADNLLILEPCLHFGLENTVHVQARPFVAIFISESSLAVHFMIFPLTLVDATVWELVGTLAVVLIGQPLAHIDRSADIPIHS